MPITVYTRPSCGPCRATRSALARQGTPYETVDISTDADARDFVMSLGYLQTPVVVTGAEHWSGFRLDRIKALAEWDLLSFNATFAG